jgi:molecular chaperone GrpE
LPEEEETEEVAPKEREDHEEHDIEISEGDEVAEDTPKSDESDKPDASSGVKTGGPSKKKARRRTQKELEEEVETLSEELERVSGELEEIKDKFLRGLADFDNYKKRVNRERERLVRCANEDLIKRLLEVVDNLERALAAESETEDLEAFK